MAERFHPLHVWRIKVKPRGRRYFWVVSIYPSYDELNGWIATCKSEDPWADQQRRGRQYAACVLHCKRAPVAGCYGFIVFTTQQLGAGIVAHEMTHAALRTLGLGLGRRLGRANEEKLACTVEHLVKEF